MYTFVFNDQISNPNTFLFHIVSGDIIYIWLNFPLHTRYNYYRKNSC